jgi:hypothetical protein
MINDEQDILDGLSEQISLALRQLDQEQEAPGFNPDRSDSTIRDLKKKVVRLREIRTDLEHVFFGGILDYFPSSVPTPAKPVEDDGIPF